MAAPEPAELVVVSSDAPNEVLDQSVALGSLDGLPGVLAQGTIGGGPAGAADVQWYSFTLDRAARVTSELAPRSQDGSFQGVLSLFNDAPFDFQDPYDPTGHRLLEQVVADDQGTAATLDRVLGPGTYYVAVSGAGNESFHPLIAGSGLPGSTGDFDLQLQAVDVAPEWTGGAAVLGSDPAPNARVDRSPFVIRIGLSGPIDPGSILDGLTVFLTATTADASGNLSEQEIALAGTNVSTSGNELQLILAAPLAPGQYKVTLAGDAGSGQPVIAGFDGTPLGMDDDHPSGQDFTYTFDVAGVEGNPDTSAPADDTPAGAHELGDVTTVGIVQVGGAVGDDPFYNPANSEDPYNPDPIYLAGNDVDLYHFRISGPGRYAFVSEVFAGRIGSPLDPGVSLFRLDPDDHQLHFVAGNNNSYNPTRTSDGWSTPLYSDPVLIASLTEGDYYLAVAGGSNTPSPLENVAPGSDGLFDPEVSHSGQLGFSTGPYVLNLVVRQVADAPHVLATNPSDGATFDHPPTELVIKFDRPANIPQLAFQSFQTTAKSVVSPVYIVGQDGTRYLPRFVSYDDTTNEARFLMLDGLADGSYELHLSGGDGLADLAGNALAGGEDGGDFVVQFTVDGPQRGTDGDPLHWTDEESHDDLGNPQDLGVLFPHELEAGVKITRDFTQDPSAAPADTADVYRFQILQSRTFVFTLSGSNLPRGVKLSLTNSSGQKVNLNSLNGGKTLLGILAPGTYVLSANGWAEEVAADVAYQILLAFTSSSDNAPPLVAGPAPILAVRLDSVAPPNTPTDPPPVTPPTIDPPPVTPPTIDPPVTPVPPTVPGGGVPPTGGGPGGPPGGPGGGGPVGGGSAPGSIGYPLPFVPNVAPTPEGGPLVSINVPSATSALQAATQAPSTDLVVLANGSVGGAGMAEEWQAAPSNLAQNGTPLLSSAVITGLLVTTMPTPWAAQEEEVPTDEEEPTALFEGLGTDDVSTGLVETVAWLAGVFPELLALWSLSRQWLLPESGPAEVTSMAPAVGVEMVAAAGAAVAGIEEDAEAGAAVAGLEAPAEEPAAAAEDPEAAPADWERAGLAALAAAGAVTLLFDRGRGLDRRGSRRADGAKRGIRGPARRSPSKSVLGVIPRPFSLGSGRSLEHELNARRDG